MRAVPQEAVAFASAALSAAPVDLCEIRPMKCGMTNRSFRFSCRNGEYILRVSGEGTDKLISRRQEAAVYERLNGSGLCDEVLAISPETGLKLTRFWEGARNCNPQNPGEVTRCMSVLRAFHEKRIQVAHTFDLFGQLDFYASLWGGRPSCYPDWAETRAAVERLRPFLAAQPHDWCLTHIDAVPDNFLFIPGPDGESVRLIDWEYAGMQDPHVDIAMFAIYAGYDRAAFDRLIDTYFQGDCAPAVRRKIYAYAAVCGLLWSNWCEYKEQLGVGFGDYALRQYDYARDYARICMEGGGGT